MYGRQAMYDVIATDVAPWDLEVFRFANRLQYTTYRPKLFQKMHLLDGSKCLGLDFLPGSGSGPGPCYDPPGNVLSTPTIRNIR